MNLHYRRQKTVERECWSKQGKDGVSALDNVFVHILLLFLQAGHHETQVLVTVNNSNSIAIKCPWFDILVVGHVQLRSSYHNLAK